MIVTDRVRPALTWPLGVRTTAPSGKAASVIVTGPSLVMVAVPVKSFAI
jgi:hypothetical protein